MERSDVQYKIHRGGIMKSWVKRIMVGIRYLSCVTDASPLAVRKRVEGCSVNEQH